METLQLPQDLYWGMTKSEPPSPICDTAAEQLFPSISLFSPKLESESEDDAEDVLLDAETEELIASALMEGDILLEFEVSDEKGQWDCIQNGASYSSHLLPLPITTVHLKDSTSELKRYSDTADIIQLSHEAFASENFNFPITSYPYAQQQQQHQPQQQQQQQSLPQLPIVQQQQQQPQLTKIDYGNFLFDLNSQTITNSTTPNISNSNNNNEIKSEYLKSPIPSSSSLIPPSSPSAASTTSTSSSTSAFAEESTESERGDEIVDEILRKYSKNLPDINDFDNDDNDSQYSSSSFYSADVEYQHINNNSMDSIPSPISNHDYPLSIKSSGDELYLSTSQEILNQTGDGIDDGISSRNSNSSSCSISDDQNSISDDSGSHSTSATSSGSNKKRSRLYVRNVDEKKSRKKEQNKNAATRYRQKKKMEMKLDLDEENILLEKNQKLRKTVEECQREVKYLKKLIKEFYKKDKN